MFKPRIFEIQNMEDYVAHFTINFDFGSTIIYCGDISLFTLCQCVETKILTVSSKVCLHIDISSEIDTFLDFLLR